MIWSRVTRVTGVVQCVYIFILEHDYNHDHSTTMHDITSCSSASHHLFSKLGLIVIKRIGYVFIYSVSSYVHLTANGDGVAERHCMEL